MNSTIEHIEYLLINHDCVIVPNWGAFISNYTPASIDIRSGKINPPVRTISFNESVRNNDGLLANSLCRKESVSYSEAVSIINSDIEALKIQLKQDGIVEFGRMGTFELNRNENLIFNPNTGSSISDGYGLNSFSVRKRGDEQNDDNEIYSDFDKEEIKESFIRKSLRYASSIVILIGLLFVLSTPAEINLSNTEMASLNLIKQKKELAQQLENFNGELLISLPPASACEVDDQPQIICYDAQNIDKYYLVIASFPSEELAVDHIRNSKNLSDGMGFS